ncbi:MAG: hypothetical protein V7K64_05095 [Nostoc sp.]|uniref:hypothetical protein n=1 Tax=unclassified Nostoc TaxID=2593658 RepID=UPI0025E3BD9F|nr:hypothetical protein [Nostoc sp. JL34]
MSVLEGVDRMTLADLIPMARKLSPSEKLKLIRILAEDLDTVEDISPLEPFKTYDLPTPYNSFGAGTVMMEALKSQDSIH